MRTRLKRLWFSAVVIVSGAAVSCLETTNQTVETRTAGIEDGSSCTPEACSSQSGEWRETDLASGPVVDDPSCSATSCVQACEHHEPPPNGSSPDIVKFCCYCD